MKSCPTCNHTYADDTLNFCLMDGSALSAPYDSQKPQRPAPPPTELFPPALRPTETTQPHPAMPGPTLPAFMAKARQVEAQKRRGKGWLIAVSTVLLIVLIGGGIWVVALLSMNKKEDGTEIRRWLTMLGRGGNVQVVVRETSAELARNPRNALALRARSDAYYLSNETDQGKRDAEEVERLLANAGSAEEYEARSEERRVGKECRGRWAG